MDAPWLLTTILEIDYCVDVAPLCSGHLLVPRSGSALRRREATIVEHWGQTAVTPVIFLFVRTTFCSSQANITIIWLQNWSLAAWEKALRTWTLSGLCYEVWPVRKTALRRTLASRLVVWHTEHLGMGTAPRIEGLVSRLGSSCWPETERCISVCTSVLTGGGAGVKPSSNTPSSCLLWMGAISAPESPTSCSLQRLLGLSTSLHVLSTLLVRTRLPCARNLPYGFPSIIATPYAANRGSSNTLRCR